MVTYSESIKLLAVLDYFVVEVEVEGKGLVLEFRMVLLGAAAAGAR
jgi:hypothetical protein